MSAYAFIFIFSVSLVSGVIALICWLLEVIFKKLHLNVISEIFANFKCMTIIVASLFIGIFIIVLVLIGLCIISKYIACLISYVADFIFSLF